MSDSLEMKVYAYGKNKLVSDAIHFATNAHADTFRKGSELPYILHPMEVAAVAAGLVSECTVAEKLSGDPNEVIAAAVLHDTLEDTPTTKEQLVVAFGSSVAELVGNESENKREEMAAEETWKIRKQETISHLNSCTDLRVKVIAFADKLSNLRAMYRDYLNLGDGLWERFNQQDSREHGWYYTSVFEACSELAGTAAYEEYRSLLEKNFFHMYGKTHI